MDKPIEASASSGDEVEENDKPKRLKGSHPKEPTSPTTGPYLLDLSDDVLLIILSFLPQIDIIMLGRTCSRFDTLILDRTLWVLVDCRGRNIDVGTYRTALLNLLPTTRSLALDLGGVSGAIPVKDDNSSLSEMAVLRARHCTALTSLTLENARIDACRLQISHFPARLTYWSLKGSTVEDLPFERSYFMDLHVHMPNLQTLVLSECPWFQAHSLMAIAKCQLLRELRLDGCIHLGNCMAYCSMSARFAFKSLETLDVRRTRLSDSEIGCFNRVTTLKHLLVESLPGRDHIEFAQNVAEDSITCHVLPSRCMIVLDRVNNEYIVDRQVVLRPDIHEDEINHIIRNVDSMDRFIDQGRACVEGAAPVHVAVRSRNAAKMCIDVDTFGNRRLGAAGCSRDDGAGPSRQEVAVEAPQRREDTVQRQVWHGVGPDADDASLEDNAIVVDVNALRPNVAHYAVEDGPFRPTNFTGPDFIVSYPPPARDGETGADFNRRLSPHRNPSPVADAGAESDERRNKESAESGERRNTANADSVERRINGSAASDEPRGSAGTDPEALADNALDLGVARPNSHEVGNAGPAISNVDLNMPVWDSNRALQTDSHGPQPAAESTPKARPHPSPKRRATPNRTPNSAPLGESTQTDNVATEPSRLEDSSDTGDSHSDSEDFTVANGCLARRLPSRRRKFHRKTDLENGAVRALRETDQPAADRPIGNVPVPGPVCVDDNAVNVELGGGRVGEDRDEDSKPRQEGGAGDNGGARRFIATAPYDWQKFLWERADLLTGDLEDDDGDAAGGDGRGPSEGEADSGAEEKDEVPRPKPGNKSQIRKAERLCVPADATTVAEASDPAIAASDPAIAAAADPADASLACKAACATSAAVNAMVTTAHVAKAELRRLTQQRAAEDALDRLGANWEARSSSDEEDNAERARLQTLLRCAKKNGEVAGAGIQPKDVGPGAKAENDRAGPSGYLEERMSLTEAGPSAPDNAGQDGAGPSNAPQVDIASLPWGRLPVGRLLGRHHGGSCVRFLVPPSRHLVTDSAVQDLFARDVDWPYMVRIAVEPSTPSRLETLVLRGYPGVTDQSLGVLAMVPTLRALDITGTGVTALGVADFRNLRPDVNLASSFD